jgi:DNA-binding transcriptional regulator YhcF (GntR family)
MVHEKELIDYSTGELKKVNYGFTQLYDDKAPLLMKIAENASAMKLFIWLYSHMDDRNALVVSQEAAAEALSVHRTTIHRAVEYLKEKKILAVLKSGNTNIYAINSEIAWKSDANSKKYAHFTAKVYITADEQDVDYQTVLFGHAVKKPQKKKKLKVESKL